MAGIFGRPERRRRRTQRRATSARGEERSARRTTRHSRNPLAGLLGAPKRAATRRRTTRRSRQPSLLAAIERGFGIRRGNRKRRG